MMRDLNVVRRVSVGSRVVLAVALRVVLVALAGAVVAATACRRMVDAGLGRAAGVVRVCWPPVRALAALVAVAGAVALMLAPLLAAVTGVR
ncbi:hypothetical protein [Actinomadura litoris]|uniref:Uncharacterized protein n=1 Tax=Actinomadura litoris TaxID=2678616 RepID=A0A7K1LDT2_9ACTN|nr:hypothetical protein [Actinomadura litoris]MUN42574.1 hypothetical protein [Actinomadura litoris]